MKGPPRSISQVMEPKIIKCIAITLPEGLRTGNGVTARHQEMCPPGRLETATISLGIHLVASEEQPYGKNNSQIQEYGLEEQERDKCVNMERSCP